MSVGLFGLLDDVAAIARLAAASIDDVGAATAKATAKAAGVVVDDTAVTPQYVQGIAAERELPIIKRIALGSIRNKLFIILPAALLLSAFLPAALPILLMIGGTYLAFEGVEKIWGKLAGHDDHAAPVTEVGPEAEKAMVAGAIRTDLILSAEIMVISLATIADDGGFWLQLATLLVVAVVITVGVYGVVALIVKMDDIGLALADGATGFRERFGRGLVAAMPKVLTVITVVGTVAMLWVGGHLLLVNVHDVGWWEAPYDWVHHLEEDIHDAVAGAGSFLAWCVNTVASFFVGVIVGAIAVLLMHLVPRKKGLDQAGH